MKLGKGVSEVKNNDFSRKNGQRIFDPVAPGFLPRLYSKPLLNRYGDKQSSACKRKRRPGLAGTPSLQSCFD
jgi:hypothetical protein